ncbi:hypothetical protein XA68_17757 [Ophiocordyceps unilateralis]|uniref:Uncharacterized protein n=1 Tax=Ophiocordyceps unilateralis TaxID=268505 RepID=A0A2A9PRR4_OPHUN|nr:hypothetical protein XA68_17757 [Ophiocordyceps unilateralis]
MCTTNVYTYIYPNNAKTISRRLAPCSASRQGQPCRDNIVLNHPLIMAIPAPAPAPAPYPFPNHQLPPTPPADESDRARRRSTSDHRRNTAYIEDHHHQHQHQQQQQHHHHQPSHRRLSSSRRDRVVLVENPPAARTPPQTYSAPHTAPSSPRFSSAAAARPVIVDESQGPSVQIEVPESRRHHHHHHHHRHHRHSSTSSRDSSHRPSSKEGDNEQSNRRRHRRSSNSSNFVFETETEAMERRELRIRQRIFEANAEIAGRAPVPLASTPRRSSTRDDHDRAREAELVDTLRRLDLQERRLVQRAEEERMGRLRERLELPRRRSTVGPGSRRHRVLYDDGIYRWE